MKVKIKRGPKAVLLPSYAKRGDAGIDLRATSKKLVTNEDESEYIEYGTDLYIAIPEGYMGLLFPRSSISTKDLLLANGVGVIDSQYRGELKVRFKIKTGYYQLFQENEDGEVAMFLSAIDRDRDLITDFPQYKIGDKIAQLIIVPFPVIEWEEVESLPETERGAGGFGSSGA